MPRSDGNVVEWQDFALVSQEVRTVCNDSLGNAIEVLHLVGFEFLKDSLQPINEPALLLSLVHVRRAQVGNDGGVCRKDRYRSAFREGEDYESLHGS